MNEIRDNAKKNINGLLDKYHKGICFFQDGSYPCQNEKDPDCTDCLCNQILSIKELAIIDREAKLPNYIGAAIAGTLKDWVKEIKE